MKPTQHPTTNLMLRPAPGDEAVVVSLPCTRGPEGIRSFWRPSGAELIALNAGALVELYCASSTHPPLWVGVDGVASGE